jgi:disulfide bond formation protein DsbB
MKDRQELSFYLYSAWLVAWVALLGSLYYGEVVGYEPCPLCWYQRCCLFPLTILLGMGAWYRDGHIARYGLPLALIGFIVALYQVLTPFFWPALACHDVQDSCMDEPKLFGYLPLSWISSVVFLWIAGNLVCVLKRNAQ